MLEVSSTGHTSHISDLELKHQSAALPDCLILSCIALNAAKCAKGYS